MPVMTSEGLPREGVAVPPGREKPCGLAPTCSSQRQGARSTWQHREQHLLCLPQQAAEPLPTSSCARRWHALCSGQEESVVRIWGVLTVN